MWKIKNRFKFSFSNRFFHHIITDAANLVALLNKNVSKLKTIILIRFPKKFVFNNPRQNKNKIISLLK
jgi:hypothetical protein